MHAEVVLLSLDTTLPSYITAGNSSSMKSSKQCRVSNLTIAEKRSRENSSEQATKRQRISSKHSDENLDNVFDIFNQSDQIIFTDYE